MPARFSLLDDLPLNDHGKIDRSRLPAPWQPRQVSDVEYVPARTQAQRELTDIWSDVLGVREIGVNDNFFELGGDSLASVEMLTLASKAFGCQFSARDLIEHQTVAELTDRAMMRFPGRVLYLTDRAELMRRQLAGSDLEPADGMAYLRDEISTDEIIPAR